MRFHFRQHSGITLSTSQLLAASSPHMPSKAGGMLVFLTGPLCYCQLLRNVIEASILQREGGQSARERQPHPRSHGYTIPLPGILTH